MLTRAPPEAPGFIAAVVWMNFSEVVPFEILRSTAETMPWVTLPSRPAEAPIAKTSSPVFTGSVAKTAGLRSPWLSILRMARSLLESPETKEAL